MLQVLNTSQMRSWAQPWGTEALLQDTQVTAMKSGSLQRECGHIPGKEKEARTGPGLAPGQRLHGPLHWHSPSACA